MVFYHNREQTALRQKQVFIDEDNIKDSTYQTSANGSFTVAGLEAGPYIVEELAMMQNRPGSDGGLMAAVGNWVAVGQAASMLVPALRADKTVRPALCGQISPLSQSDSETHLGAFSAFFTRLIFFLLVSCLYFILRATLFSGFLGR